MNNKSNNPGTMLWLYMVLTYALSWVFWIPIVISGQDPTSTAWLIPFAVGGFSPSFAGILLIHWFGDREACRDFWRRVLSARLISPGWFFFILLVFPALFGLSFLLDRMMGESVQGFVLMRQLSATPWMFVVVLLSGVITGPLSEELGWRGFALEQLQRRWSALASSLILSLFWWGWHLPLFFIEGTTQKKLGLGTVDSLVFSLNIVLLTILMTWVYNHTHRSILAAVLMHLMYNVTATLTYPFPTIQTLLLFVVTAATVVLQKDAGGRTVESYRMIE